MKPHHDIVGKTLVDLLDIFAMALAIGVITSYAIDYIGVDAIAAWSRYSAFLYAPLIGFVIQLIVNLSSLCDLEGLKSQERFKLEKIVKRKIRHFWYLAAFYFIAMFVSVLSPLWVNVGDVFAYWGIFIVGVALGMSIYWATYVLKGFNEISDFRWKVKNQMVLGEERNNLLDTMRDEAS